MAKTFGIFLLVCAICADNRDFCDQPNPSTRERVIELAASQVGVREVGSNQGKEVEDYLAVTGLGPGYAWCVAFIAWTYDSVGVGIPESAAWSPAWFPQSKVIETVNAKPGDVHGFYYQSKGRIAHGAIHERFSGTTVITIEGNTNKLGSREGDGVYRKRRHSRSIHKTAKWIK